MPDGAVYVGRPSRWGNPFRIGDMLPFPYGARMEAGACVQSQEHSVELFRAYTRITTFYDSMVRQDLRGKDLCCWCDLDRPCHADVLLELANGGAA